MRRSFSEQITKVPGPSSKFAEMVLSVVVEPGRRDEVRARFAVLYAAARGEPAPFAPAAMPCTVTAELTVTAEAESQATAVPEASPAAREATGELQELFADVQIRLRAAEQREAAALNELAARTDENLRLQENLAAMHLATRVPAQRTPVGIRVARADRATPPAEYMPPRPRPNANFVLSPNEHAATRWLNEWNDNHPGETLELEDYWLGGIWDDLRRPQLVRDGLEDSEVASQFGDITRNLTRDGLDVATGGRVPRQWTSQGPPWFYTLFGAIVMASIIVLAFVLPALVNKPSPLPTNNENLLVDLINNNNRYPCGRSAR